jgi:hypothetical protein
LLRVTLIHRDLISSLIEFHDMNSTRSSMGIIEQAMWHHTLVQTSSSLSPSPDDDTHPKISSRNKGAKMVVDIFVSKKEGRRLKIQLKKLSTMFEDFYCYHVLTIPLHHLIQDLLWETCVKYISPVQSKIFLSESAHRTTRSWQETT